MTISATIIADSIQRSNFRITTMQLRYPRFIHAEFMTHRQFSRNASSSRAIPVQRLIDDVQNDPVYPSYWGANQKGMQAGEEINAQLEMLHPLHDQYLIISRVEGWDAARNWAILIAQAFDKAGYHKQIVNRLLEPFSHINVVVTSTEWSNFFALRCHKDAQPEINELATKMRDAYNNSIPELLGEDDWHLPYVDKEATRDLLLEMMPTNAKVHNWVLVRQRELSVARCARVSYLTHEGKVPDIKDDLKLYERLVGAVPLHASPCEHQATPDPNLANRHLWGNLKGWIQFRKTLTGECQ